MDAPQAFAQFVKKVLVPEKADRLNSLALSEKGQRKILAGLCHQFGAAVRSDAVRTRDFDTVWERPCFVFYASIGFGVEFESVRSAYEKLSIEDSWLILLTDASAGIYRPEAKWDAERLIVA